MGKRRKKKAGDKAEQASPATGEQFRSRPFADALGGLKAQAKARGAEASAPPPPPKRVPRPVARAGHGSSPLSDDDRDALGMAMVGVTPLRDGGPRRVSRSAAGAPSRTAEVAQQAEGSEERARARLDALVAAGVSFRVERQDEFVRAARLGLDPGVLRRLGQRRGADETLDLHGLSQPEARRALLQFVRRSHRKGLSLVCVVHGKGLHSEDGVGVLRELAIDTLVDSGCAPCVLAFCTAPQVLGGTGALLVELSHR